MERILIPTDFSVHANAALAHAILFAEAFAAEAHLLNVQVPYGPTSPLVDEFPGEAEARATLDSLTVGSRPVVRAVRRGFAAGPAILEYASDEQIDLIAMGSHGYRGIPRLLLGSVAEDVVRGSACPVLVVHEPEVEAPAYRKLLVPVDFSGETEAQMQVAVDLAERFGAALDIVHVIDPPTVPELYVPVGPIATDMKTIAVNAAMELEDVAGPLRDSFEVTTEVLVGRAGKTIARRARDADLVVMPTHGHSGFERVLIGSVTEGVLRRVEGAVLALKPVDTPNTQSSL